MTKPELEQITLNAIRWRAKDGDDSETMAKSDRKWLLAYIDRHELWLDESSVDYRRTGTR